MWSWPIYQVLMHLFEENSPLFGKLSWTSVTCILNFNNSLSISVNTCSTHVFFIHLILFCAVSARSYSPKEILHSQYSGVSGSSGFLNWSDRFDTSYLSSSKLWQVWWLSSAFCFFSYLPLQSSGWICLVESLISRMLKGSWLPQGAILTTFFGRWYLCSR